MVFSRSRVRYAIRRVERQVGGGGVVGVGGVELGGELGSVGDDGGGGGGGGVVGEGGGGVWSARHVCGGDDAIWGGGGGCESGWEVGSGGGEQWIGECVGAAGE